jgi:hypothetical protein
LRVVAAKPPRKRQPPGFRDKRSEAFKHNVSVLGLARAKFIAAVIKKKQDHKYIVTETSVK